MAEDGAKGPAVRSRWRHVVDGSWLAVRVLPWIALAIGGKLVLAGIGFQPIDLNALVSGLIAATVFLLGFMLAGTVSDFKEAERLPGDMAASMESMADECLIIHESNHDSGALDCVRHLIALIDAVRDWIEKRATTDAPLARIRELNRFFAGFQGLAEIGFIVRLKSEQKELRRMLLRIEGIRSTSFVTAGYAVAGVATRLVIVILMFTDIKGTALEGALLVGLTAFVLLYMNRLVRDLDDPFEFRNGVRGTADVSLRPLYAAGERLTALVDGAGGGTAAARP